MFRDDVSGSAEDTAIFFVLSKLDQFKNETHYYENKYKKSLQEVKTQSPKIMGKDGYQVQEDLHEWESAASSLKFWEQKYHKINENDLI